ncbi:MAG TPA: hypothetical protein VK665_02590 [Candidatus Elarobacter sp.]|nr:hypothetical protein [Candidatus Elarobacter sp.]
MILNDQEIEDRCVGGSDLIQPFDRSNLSNCSYLLHAETVFLPETGEEARIDPNSSRRIWTIKPGEAVVVMLAERVHLTDTLLGMYTQLNRWATKGLSLMNASLVEPLYAGPLSCQLVNFSKETIHLAPGDEIAKLTFHTLEHAPVRPKPQSVSPMRYRNALAESASRHPQSFLNLAAIRQELKETARREAGTTANRTLREGSAFLAILLILATVQPWFSDMFAKRTGLMIDASTKEVAELRDELKREGANAYSERLGRQIDALSSKLDAESRTVRLEAARIQSLQRTVNGLKAKR